MSSERIIVIDHATSPIAIENMINRLWKIFDTNTDNIHEHATRQLSDIMRFHEIHWKLHYEKTQSQDQ